MRLNALNQMRHSDFGPVSAGPRRQDSQVNLKAPRQDEPEDAETEQFVSAAPFDAPADFVEFISEERGIASTDAFDLLCRLVAEYRTPVRREIDVLQLSA
jgi:hypothetical protein